MSLAKRLLAAAAALREAAPAKDDVPETKEDDDDQPKPQALTSSTRVDANRRFIEYAKSSCAAAFVSSRLNVTFEDVTVHVRSDGLFVCDRTKLLLRHVALPTVAQAVWLPPVEDPQGRPGGARLRLVIRGEHDILLTRSSVADTAARKKELAVKAGLEPSKKVVAAATTNWRESEDSLFTIANNLRIATQTNGDFCPFIEREGVPKSADDPEASPAGLVALRPAADYQSAFVRAQLRRRGSDKYVPPEDQLTLAAWDSIEAPLPPALPIEEVPAWARWAVPHGAHTVMFGNVLLLHPVAYFDEENRPVIVERAARLRGAALAAAFDTDGGTRSAISKKAKKRLETSAGGGRGDVVDDDDVVPAVLIFTGTHLLIVYDPLRTVRLHLTTLQTAIVHRTTTKRPPRRVEFMFTTAEASCTVDVALGTHPYKAGAAVQPQDDGDDQQTYNAAIVADVVVSLSNRLGIDVKVSQRNEVAAQATVAGPQSPPSSLARKASMATPPSGNTSELRATDVASPIVIRRPADDDNSESEEDGVSSPPPSDSFFAPLFRHVASPHLANNDDDDVVEGAAQTLRNDSRLTGEWDPVSAKRWGGWDGTARWRRNAARTRAVARPFRALCQVPDRHEMPKAYVTRFNLPDALLVRRVLRETSKQSLVKRYVVVIGEKQSEETTRMFEGRTEHLFDDTDESQDTDNDLAIGNAVYKRASRPRVSKLLLCDDKGVVHREIPVDTICRINCVSAEDVVAIFVKGERPVLLRPDGDKTRNPVAPDGGIQSLGLRVTDIVTIMARSTGPKPYVVSNPRESLNAAAVTTEEDATQWAKEYAIDRARQDEEARRGRELAIKVAARAAATAAFRKDLVAKVAKQHAQEQRQQEALAAVETAARRRHSVVDSSSIALDPNMSPILKNREDSSLVTMSSPLGSPTAAPADPSAATSPHAASAKKKRPLMATVGGSSSLHTAVLNEERVHRNVIEDSELGVLRVLWMREATDRRKALEAHVKRDVKTLWSRERVERSCLLVERSEGVDRLTAVAKGMRGLVSLIRAGEVLHLHAREDINRRRIEIDREVSAFRLLKEAKDQLASWHLEEDAVGCESRESQTRRGIAFDEARSRVEVDAERYHAVTSMTLLRHHSQLCAQVRDRFLFGVDATHAHMALGRHRLDTTQLFVSAMEHRVQLVAEWRVSVSAAYHLLQRAAVEFELMPRSRRETMVSEEQRRARVHLLGAASHTLVAEYSSASRILRQLRDASVLLIQQSTARASIVEAANKHFASLTERFRTLGVVLAEAAQRRALSLLFATTLQCSRREVQARLALYQLEGGEYRHIKSDFIGTLPHPDHGSFTTTGGLVAMEMHLNNLRTYRRLTANDPDVATVTPIHTTPQDVSEVASRVTDRALALDQEDPALRSLIAQESSGRSDIAANELHSRPVLNFHLFTKRPVQRARGATFVQRPVVSGSPVPSSSSATVMPWDQEPSGAFDRQRSSSPLPGRGGGTVASEDSPFSRQSPPIGITPAFNPNGDHFTSEKKAEFLTGRPTPLATPERGAYEAIGLLRVRVKAPLSTFLFYCNKGFSRRLEAAGGAGSAWSNIPPESKCVCVGEALHGAAVVSSQTLQRLMLNSSVVSCGNGGSGGGSSAGMPAAPAEMSSVALAGFDPVISRHVSVRLASLLFVAVDVHDFLPRWGAGQEPCDMVVPD